MQALLMTALLFAAGAANAHVKGPVAPNDTIQPDKTLTLEIMRSRREDVIEERAERAAYLARKIATARPLTV
jgi:hypothetical protein